MLARAEIDRVVSAALAEDAPWGDVTAEAFVPASARARAELVAREPGTFSGGAVFAAAFALTDTAISVALHRADGEAFTAGDVLATVEGPARGVLTAERVALNFTQRMSGIATLTSRYVEAVAGTGARIADTRKTTPGLRAFEKHAVRCGGGHNHRFGLYDAVMIKDNHIAASGGIAKALADAREALGHMVKIEIEVDSLDQHEEALANGADVVLLDNMAPADLKRAVEINKGRAVLSGEV